MNNEEKAVLIQGKIDINRAVDGDQVVIEVYPKKDWKAESELLVLNDNEEEEDIKQFYLEQARDCIVSAGGGYDP